MNLTPEEKKYLLALSRRIIVLKAEGKEYEKEEYFTTSLKQQTGVFITLNKSHQLRGCIGYVEGLKALQNAVEEMSLAAAFEDPRFPPIEKDEIKDIEIEISVLSPLETISDTSQIEIGRHGIIIEKGLMRGLLLPQVATDYNWDVQTFLEQTCQKAGLPAGAWKEESTEIQIFSAEIFSESDLF
ncbi:MAG: AmmeMemoRadiSam system protein A [Calditrichia bacterium]|nr:AmmeMemoRadiSam system protein A [Calditrichia bacterium]